MDKGYRKIQAMFKIITAGSGPTWVESEHFLCPLEIKKRKSPRSSKLWSLFEGLSRLASQPAIPPRPFLRRPAVLLLDLHGS